MISHEIDPCLARRQKRVVDARGLCEERGLERHAPQAAAPEKALFTT